MQSWRRLNPGWEIRFYDDEACLEFVSREFPEYLEAYRVLPKHVERSDFFRYMVCSSFVTLAGCHLMHGLHKELFTAA